MKILFFDSGVGGLTIFNKCVNEVNADFFYLADNINTPYGIKEKEIVKKIVIENIKKIYQFEPDIIVIACNTATSVAINDLRKIFKEKYIIGTEPAVKVAADSNCINKRILVCATTLTTKEEKLNNLIKSLDIENKTDFLPLDKLVEYAEKLEFNSISVEEYLKEKFNVIDLKQYSHIVLGCTHFPLFYDVISKIVPQNIQIIDSSEGVVKNIKRKIKELNLEENKKSNVTLLLTKDESNFTEKFSQITHLQDFSVKII